MLIGVVGKSGSGKSSLVRKMMSFDNSIVHIDIDEIGRDILRDAEIVKEIVRIVGDCSVVVNGVLDRKRVGRIIFNDVKKYEDYYKYTEKIEYSIIDKIIENNNGKKIVLDWFTLNRTKYWGFLDYKILVDASYDIRKRRVISRDKISEDYFDLREKKMLDYNRDEMDFIIDGSFSDDEVKHLLGELK